MNRVATNALTLGVVIAGTIGSLFANDIFLYDSKECFEPNMRRRSVWAGFGHLSAQANEIVYGGPGGAGGDELSHLIWDVNDALTFNLGFEGEVNDCVNLFAEGVFSLSADDSQMVDYDWLLPTSDWSHRSVHPNTDLNHYVQIDLGLDYKLCESDCFTLSLRGAYRYTDISFDAYGGSFIYSGAGFRDTAGSFGDEIAISYRQKLPGFYLGPRVGWSINERLRLKAGALAGFTFSPEARDHHWMRELLFVDRLEGAAFYGANLGIDYALSDCTVLYLEGAYDQYESTRGYTEITDSSGATGVTPHNSAGADLQTTQIKAGVRFDSWHKPLTPNCFVPGCFNILD
jgi:outer membrane protease